MKAVLKIIRVGRRVEPGLLVVAWGVSIAALTLAEIFQGHLIPQRYYGGATGQFFSVETGFYLEVLAVSVLAGLVINDPPRAILSFFGSYVVSGIVIFVVLSLPAFVNNALPEIIFNAAIAFTFTSLFPIPLVIGLVGTILGVALSERYVK